MLNRYFLSVADVSILFDSDQPLIENEEFFPFVTGKTIADIHMTVRRMDDPPAIPQEKLYADRFCLVSKNREGYLQKFFFANDGGQYTVSTYYPDGRNILMEYPSSYSGVLDLQNCFYCLGFEEYLLRRNRLCLHASCVDTPLGGLLFSGVSGIGKSTQADLWCRYRGAKQINGDRPILSREEHNWLAWGSPYAGSSRVYVNESCPVTAIVLLKQSPVCKLRRLSASEAFLGVWAGLTVHTWDASYVAAASDLTIDLVTTVPVYEFSCTPDEAAVEFLEQELRKEHCV